jgi:hypothetical protein
MPSMTNCLLASASLNAGTLPSSIAQYLHPW